jgi:hypothetical protein
MAPFCQVGEIAYPLIASTEPESYFLRPAAVGTQCL